MFTIISHYGYLIKSAEETSACTSVQAALSKQGHHFLGQWGRSCGSPAALPGDSEVCFDLRCPVPHRSCLLSLAEVLVCSITTPLWWMCCCCCSDKHGIKPEAERELGFLVCVHLCWIPVWCVGDRSNGQEEKTSLMLSEEQASVSLKKLLLQDLSVKK